MARILVIDDEEDICRLIVKVLGRDGHTVTAKNSAAGLEAPDLNQYDLLILDVMMPEVDGFSFCYQIRRAVDCPILFLTAKTMEQDIVEGFAMGADDYIKKPFGIAELRARERIARQELGFEKNMTGIRELNAVLGSIEEMGATLEESLKAQWEMEQNRRMQISAVAHDIKIPLTVVRGNVELLLEEDFSGEDMELLEGISAGTGKIEQYLGLLSDAAKAENTGKLRAECFSVAEWMDEIERQAGAQCRRKAIVLHVEKESLPETFYGDRELLIRAVSNILDNAVEYTPQQGEITFFAGGSAGQIVFRVTDSGKGFSDSSLRFAARQFYTECKERSGKHYGLGLFVADMAARRHGGRLMLANRQDGSGAVVTLAVGRAHSS